MKVHFNIDTDDVRIMCVRNDFYTCGNNRAYAHMFNMCRAGTDIATIKAVAQDIIDHSADEYELREVMETILNTCTYISVEEDEADDGKGSSAGS